MRGLLILILVAASVTLIGYTAYLLAPRMRRSVGGSADGDSGDAGNSGAVCGPDAWRALFAPENYENVTVCAAETRRGDREITTTYLADGSMLRDSAQTERFERRLYLRRPDGRYFFFDPQPNSDRWEITEERFPPRVRADDYLLFTGLLPFAPLGDAAVWHADGAYWEIACAGFFRALGCAYRIYVDSGRISRVEQTEGGDASLIFSGYGTTKIVLPTEDAPGGEDTPA